MAGEEWTTPTVREPKLLLFVGTVCEKKGAMEIRTVGQIVDYVLALAATRPAR